MFGFLEPWSNTKNFIFIYEKMEMEIKTVMDLGARRSTRTRRLWNLDRKQTPKNKKNKQEVEMEAATPRTPSKNIPKSSKLGILKMTTPNQVKTASPKQRQPRCQESPRNLNLKRLNQQRLQPGQPRTYLLIGTSD